MQQQFSFVQWKCVKNVIAVPGTFMKRDQKPRLRPSHYYLLDDSNFNEVFTDNICHYNVASLVPEQK
jgi:hypothetical protein